VFKRAAHLVTVVISGVNRDSENCVQTFTIIICYDISVKVGMR
jgi:hypothetical protein